jgi:spore maturation protein CgeB
MNRFSKISELMKSDWDRRVKHDYRFWMSDGRENDTAMWESGRRDLEIICSGIADPEEKVVLEIGCGVGRLLNAAVDKYWRVIGIDVSEEAISKAKELLPAYDTLQLITGNGVDLHPVPDNSVDLVISFASITSIPTDVIANYLIEIHRVLKPTGVVRLQMYLGKEQPVRTTDTLHLRCYQRENLESAAALAGFEVEFIEQLELPFQISSGEAGFEAVKVSLKPLDSTPAEAEEISRALLPQGELTVTEMVEADDLEYWMTVNYAKELADEGQYEKARETLEYAVSFGKAATIDVRDLLDRIVNKISQAAEGREEPAVSEGEQSAHQDIDSRVLDKNLSILRERFPDVYCFLKDIPVNVDQTVEVSETMEGPVILLEGQCLDHISKPRSSGDVWAKRVLKEARTEECGQIAVFGFAAGYHIESLLKLTDKDISVIEPELKVFMRALELRDLSDLIPRLKGLSVGRQENLDCLDENSELVIRPQTQMLALEYHKKVRSYFYAARGIKSIRPRIAVLGPIQGGTLPILPSTVRGLLLEHQRAREIDMSGFAEGYHAIGKILNNELIQASTQGKYVETLSQVVLNSVTEKPIDILICMAQAPITMETLTELRKRGIVTVLWFVEDYTRFLTWQTLAPYFDFIFTIQKDECIDAIKTAGCEEVHYLPTACDPFVHVPMDLSEEECQRWGSPISFMGAGYHNRQQMFASLANMPFKIWGTEWPECKPFDKLVQENGRRLKPEEYVKIFNATTININLHSSTERDGVDPNGDFLNPRTFELAGIGAFQLVDERKLLPEVFEPGKEVITFSDTRDLKEKIYYYLEHDEERQRIAENARARALREHTYQHRIKTMLSTIYSSHFERLKRRVDDEPWNKILQRAKKFPELYERCKAAYERGEQPGLDGLVSDIATGQGSLTETEQKLLFLFHVSKQIIRMVQEEKGLS